MTRRPAVPLLVAALSISGGLFIQRFAAPMMGNWFWLASTVISFVAVFALHRSRIGRWIAIISLLASVAAINASFRANYGQNHIYWRLLRTKNHQGATVTIAGRVSSDASLRNGRVTFQLDAACIQLPSSCPAVAGRIRVTILDDGVTLGEGDGIVVSGRLRRPASRRNPADFDFAGWLAANDTPAILTHAQIVQHCASTTFVWKLVQSVRSRIRKNIAETIPQSARDLPLALLLGDRSMISTETRSDFSRSGLMHLLAISGLHVMLVGMMLHRLMRPILMRTGCSWPVVEGIRSSATLSLLMVYALASGSGPSVVRAVIMTGFLLAGTVARGISNPLNALGGAACFILLFDPPALYQPGFQLSFSAVIGLLMLGRGIDADLLTRSRSPVVRWILSGTITSFVATLATAPALMHHFGYVGVAGIVLNVVAIPIGAALLCSSILNCLCAFVSTHSAIVLGGAVDMLGMMLKWLARIGGASDSLVLSASSTLSFSASSLLLLMGFLTSRKGAFRRWLILVSLLPPLTSLLVSLGQGRFAPRISILFLDVGHGDAAIVRLPGKRILLSDAGNRHRFRDEGISTVIPNLKEVAANNEKDVHLAVISHPHADHLGGLPALLNRNIPTCIGDNGQPAETELYAETMRLIEANGSCYRSLSAGDTLNIDPLVRIIVLAPPSLTRLNDTNDRSVVLKIVFGRTSVLLTGDVEKEAEDFLSTRYCDLLASDVVKVPHHGSRTSSTAPFVDCVVRRKKSGHAVISVGSPLKYGLPDEEVLANWIRTGFSVHTTFNGGALWLESDGLKVQRKNWK